MKSFRMGLFRFFKMELPAAPFLGSNVSDRLGEIPVVPVEVPRVVLALAIWMVLRFSQDRSPILPRALAVCLRIFNANLDDVRFIRSDVALGDREASIAGFHLDTVIANPQTDTKSERFRQPIGGNARIWINDYRNDSARGHRPVRSHPETVSLGALNHFYFEFTFSSRRQSGRPSAPAASMPSEGST